MVIASPAAADTPPVMSASQADASKIPDQSALEAQLGQLINAGATTAKATLALLQLANFYEIRTWVGKSEASQLLADICRVLLDCLPSSVQLFRCDNYEFVLLLKDECSSNARAITAKVQTALQQAVSDTIPAQLTLHCVAGLSEISPELRSADVVLARARHNLSVQDTDIKSASGPRACPPSAIIQGLRRGQLKLNFQPLIGIDGETTAIFEVRSCLSGKTGIIDGATLFASAAANALGEALDRAVICRCLKLLQEQQFSKISLLVNLSLNSLVSQRFASWLSSRAKQEPNLTPGLILQISELDLLIAQHHLAEFDRAMQALDLPLSITHFGCSKNSLRYLPLLKVMMVKLDASLTHKLQANSVRFNALCELVQNLQEKGINTAVSQIQEPRLLPQFRRLGINRFQGNCLQVSTDQLHLPTIHPIHLD